MNLKSVRKQTQCPRCKSKAIHTMGLDQFCLDCEWDNLKLLVDCGQLDNWNKAYFEHFGVEHKDSSRRIKNKQGTNNVGGEQC